MSFSGLGLSESAIHGAQRMGFIDPTPIQLQAIPMVLKGSDLIGAAQTGTGKTAAFALPLISKLETHQRTRCLVLEPTRELAMQVETAFQDYGFFTHLQSTLVYGGVGYEQQRKALRNRVDIVVATPGRLLDHLDRGDASLKDIEYIVLDEVDRMLDMGFLPDVRRILSQAPKNRQTLMFSATMPNEIEQLAAWALKEPEKIAINFGRSPAKTITHAFYPVASAQKFELLATLLQHTSFESVLIFTRTKDGADRVASRLEKASHTVAVLHSDRAQKDRIKALDGFKSGEYQVMVATDIAARGIDVAGVSHVINYDVPTHPEDYVHRIGRTGRAQAQGDAFTLITAEDFDYIKAIEQFIEQKVPRVKVDDFKYVYSTIFNESTALAATQAARKAGSRYGKRRR